MIQFQKHDYNVKIGCDISAEEKQFFSIETTYFNMTYNQLQNTLLRAFIKMLHNSVEIKYLEVLDENGKTVNTYNSYFNIPEPVRSGIIKPRR